VITAPFQMRLQNLSRGREPDILFVLRANESRIRRTYLDGPCDLAIEVVSPESRLRDRGTKYAEYEAAGIPEYWIIDPETQRADFFELVDGRYERRHPSEAGIIDSVVFPQFWIDVAWLWAKPMPALLVVMRNWIEGESETTED
jgi:Uma2 family endonuclease